MQYIDFSRSSKIHKWTWPDHSSLPGLLPFTFQELLYWTLLLWYWFCSWIQWNGSVKFTFTFESSSGHFSPHCVVVLFKRTYRKNFLSVITENGYFSVLPVYFWIMMLVNQVTLENRDKGNFVGYLFSRLTEHNLSHLIFPCPIFSHLSC